MALKIMADNEVEISARQDGALYNVALGNTDFIIQGLGNEFSMTRTGLTVTIGTGEAVIHGRHVTAETKNTITLPANSSGYLTIRIDLTKPIGEEALFFATPTISKQEINWPGGTIYDFSIATFTTNSIDITSFNDTRVKKNTVTPEIKTINNTSLLGTGNIAVQPTLVSGTNIKTVNSTSLLGSGNIGVGVTSVAVKINGSTKGTVTSSGTIDLGSGYLTSGVFYGIDTSRIIATNPTSPYTATEDCWIYYHGRIAANKIMSYKVNDVEVTRGEVQESPATSFALVPLKKGQKFSWTDMSSNGGYVFGIKS